MVREQLPNLELCHISLDHGRVISASGSCGNLSISLFPKEEE